MRRLFPLAALLALCLPSGALAGDDVNIELVAPILVIPAEDSLVVTIPRGSVDGIILGGRGLLYRPSSEEGISTIGTAVVESVSDETSEVSVSLDPASGLASVDIGDVVEIPARVPASVRDQVAFDLVRRDIGMTNMEDEPLYTYREFVEHPDNDVDKLIFDRMARYTRRHAKLAKGVDNGETPATEGRFAGASLFQTMAHTRPENVRDFLLFVDSFPSKYMGTSWNFLEVYATWIINGGLNSPEEVKLRALALEGNYRAAYLRSVDADLHSDNPVEDWYNDARALLGESRYDEALALIALMEEVCRILDDEDAWDLTETVRGDTLRNMGDGPGAIRAYEASIAHAADDLPSQAITRNNMALVYIDLEQYEQALAEYEKALALWEEEAGAPASTVSGAAMPWRGLGDVLQKLDRYSEALQAYNNALILFRGQSSLLGFQQEASVQREVGRVLEKQGSYREAIAAWDKALAMARELGWDSTIADALDDISSGHWSLGDYPKALDYQEQAYALRLASGNAASAAYSRTDIGSLHWLLGDYDAALADYDAALAVHLDGHRSDDVANVLTRQGSLQRERGDYDAAMKHFEGALVERQAIGEAAGLADIHWEIALAREAQGRHDDATAAYEQALGFARQVGDRSLEANILDSMAIGLDKQKRSLEAEARFREALGIRQTIGDRAGECDSLLGLSWFYSGKSVDLVAATDLANEALRIARELPSPVHEARALAALGGVYETTGVVKAAFEAYEQSLAIFQRIGDQRGIASGETELGDVYEAIGDSDQAVVHYEIAVSVARASNNTAQLANSLQQIAWLKAERGFYDEARALAEQALALYTEAGDDIGRANVYNTLASIEQDLGNLGAAEAWHQQALALRKEGNDLLGMAGSLNNLGSLFLDMGDYAQAISNLEQALEIGERIGYMDVLTVTTGNLAHAYAHEGDLTRALELARRGLAVAEEKQVPPRIVQDLLLVGTMLRKQGDHAAAREALASALADAERLGMRNSIVRAQIQLGIDDWETGKFAEAVGELEAATEHARTFHIPNQLWEASFYLGRARRDSGDREGAIAAFRESVDVVERMKATIVSGEAAQDRFQADRADLYRELVDLLTSAGLNSEAFSVLARMKHEEMSGFGAAPGPQGASSPGELAAMDTVKSMEAHERDLERLLAAELEKPGKQQRSELIAKWQSEIDEVQLAFQDYTKTLEREHPDFVERLQVAPPTFFKLQADLKPNEVFVEPMILPDRIVIFVVRGGSGPLLYREVKVESARVDALVKAMRESLEQPMTPWETSRGVKVAPASGTRVDPTGPARALYELLIAPIAEDLVGADTLIISPSGRLRYIPFAALYDGAHFLIEPYRIALLTQSGAVAKHDALEKNAPLLALGNPDGSLPGAEAEVHSLAQVWGKKATDTFVGDDATKAALRGNIAEHRILHLATHGYLLNDNPEGSYLLLAGDGSEGRLTFREITLLPLNDVDLAVLSACQTAVGDHGEGTEIAGLAYQFEMRGAAAVIASLWAVDDRGTSELMQNLYENLQDSTESKAEALREAQLALLEDPTLRHPYYWAPFVLIGDWR